MAAEEGGDAVDDAGRVDAVARSVPRQTARRVCSHLALEFLHDVQETVVDVWLVVELYLRGVSICIPQQHAP